MKSLPQGIDFSNPITAVTTRDIPGLRPEETKRLIEATAIHAIFMTRKTLTVGILTLNEEKRIQACIESVKFADQILVIDSGSSDETVAIAKRCGAQVHVHADWKGFAVQRNRLLQHATGDYIFFLDADEQLPHSGHAELEKILISGEEAVWKIRWRMVAFGRELKYLRSTSLVERIFKRDMLVEFQGVVHEQAILTSQNIPRHTLQTSILHFSRDTVRDALEKLTQYSILGAKKRLDSGKRGGVVRGLLSGSTMFFRLYVAKGGFLCGSAGFLYCIFVALEAFMRYAALKYDYLSLSNDIRRGS